jgi:hypothetical protein
MPAEYCTVITSCSISYTAEILPCAPVHICTIFTGGGIREPLQHLGEPRWMMGRVNLTNLAGDGLTLSRS